MSKYLSILFLLISVSASAEDASEFDYSLIGKKIEADLIYRIKESNLELYQQIEEGNRNFPAVNVVNITYSGAFGNYAASFVYGLPREVIQGFHWMVQNALTWGTYHNPVLYKIEFSLGRFQYSCNLYHHIYGEGEISGLRSCVTKSLIEGDTQDNTYPKKFDLFGDLLLPSRTGIFYGKHRVTDARVSDEVMVGVLENIKDASIED
ncbi:MAG: hypothetical protein HOE90_13470 [Bacteriovoracaceae bacterium]|nr:hypothetical protein [Bacteriovoracaceae bacterium]